MKRRDFFRVMGIASGAALTACKVDNADRKLLPYLVPPEDGIIPGTPRYVRSTCTECPALCGIDIKIRDHKPVKLEGNPHHPLNEGALCIRGQASLARLYLPNRLRQPMLRGDDGQLKPVGWDDALNAFKAALLKAGEENKRNIYLSSHTTGSLSGLITEFCTQMKLERGKEVEIFHNGAIKEANRQLFEHPMLPQYHIDKSDVLLTVGADIFETFVSPVQFARQMKRARTNGKLQWFHVEPYITTTGAAADVRSAAKPGSEVHLLAYLLRTVTHRKEIPAENMAAVPQHSLEQTAELTGVSTGDISYMVSALNKAANPLIISGGPATANRNGQITALYTALLQWTLGCVDDTIDFSRPFNDADVGTLNHLAAVAEDCKNDKTGTLVFARMHGLTTAPAILESLKKAHFKVAFSQVPDEVTEICDLVLPLSNPLEAWGDAEPYIGVKSIIQPAVTPQGESKSEGDILLAMMGNTKTYRDYLADQWQGMGEDWINKGVNVTGPVPVTVQLKGTAIGNPGNSHTGTCLYITPSIRTYDGRSSNIKLLHEIPDPLSAVSYGKFIALSSAEAEKFNAAPGDLFTLQVAGGKFELPITINPGLTAGVVTLSIDSVSGFNFPVDEAGGQLHFCFDNVTLTNTGKKASVAVLAGGWTTGNRGILPDAPLEHHTTGGHDQHDAHGHDQKEEHPTGAVAHKKEPLYSLYEPHEHKDYRWGMVIDLDACTGCGACVAACYIENNIPMTGPEEHLRGREMSWLRIEPYYNDPGKPEFLPMMCQQCDNAPCETVCPVFATYHNAEGLNAQVYNRCVGTRYCANNCPYKARRFNWFDNEENQPLHQAANPDVSVRPKGVMEKCTFCIQRIRFAKDAAKDDKRLVKDGEVVPACAQTCPGSAITFGNLMDPWSKVSRLIKGADVYQVLQELGTRPAVYYIKSKKKAQT